LFLLKRSCDILYSEISHGIHLIKKLHETSDDVN
jgi:hypothetical protein